MVSIKYIVYEYVTNPLAFNHYTRTELKSDKELKQYLFDHQSNLKNIEIFNKENKCEIKLEVTIK